MKERLRLLLNFLLLSQKEFAKEIDVAPSTVSQWLSGKREPSSAILKLISLKFCVNLKWLEDGSGKMQSEIDDGEKKILTTSAVFSQKVYNSLMQLSNDEWMILEKIINRIKLDYEKEDR